MEAIHLIERNRIITTLEKITVENYSIIAFDRLLTIPTCSDYYFIWYLMVIIIITIIIIVNDRQVDALSVREVV